MSAQYLANEVTPNSASVVDRANAILEERMKSVAPERGVERRSFEDVPFGVIAGLERRVQDLRNQVQDLVDAFVELGERLPSLASTNSGPAGSSSVAQTLRLNPSELPALRKAEGLVGEVARTALGLVNDASQPASVMLRATSLISEHGDEIPGNQVFFLPNPLNLPAGAELPVDVSVLVPANARPGKYLGLVQAAGLEAARAVLTLDVKPRASGA